ncbi:tyrosine-type recombinase/integrase [Salinisphaera sp. T31B1]|uniref:tyrosine-type recombinase/integrase n=1 Tax=Salinisphaera sp. T31B1 TaxID=727963 RepID=UPI00333E7CBE
MEHVDQWESAHKKSAIVPWNKGRLVGPKPPLRLKEIWGIRVRLQLAAQTRDLALFNLAIDSKLRGCDLVRLKVQDVAHGGRVLSRTAIVQQKTGRPVQFELTEQTRTSIETWISAVALRANDYLFPSRVSGSPHLSTRQYARVVKSWVESIGLDPLEYGTSYCQIWCMGKKLGGFPAELAFVYSVDELDAVDDVGELFEAA